MPEVATPPRSGRAYSTVQSTAFITSMRGLRQAQLAAGVWLALPSNCKRQRFAFAPERHARKEGRHAARAAVLLVITAALNHASLPTPIGCDSWRAALSRRLLLTVRQLRVFRLHVDAVPTAGMIVTRVADSQLVARPLLTWPLSLWRICGPRPHFFAHSQAQAGLV